MSQTIASAISSGLPARPSGVVAPSTCARSGWPPLAWMSVSVRPGRTALTRMPSRPTSFDRPMVKLSTAPF